jgi:hypothetical protein
MQEVIAPLPCSTLGQNRSITPYDALSTSDRCRPRRPLPHNWRFLSRRPAASRSGPTANRIPAGPCTVKRLEIIFPRTRSLLSTPSARENFPEVSSRCYHICQTYGRLGFTALARCSMLDHPSIRPSPMRPELSFTSVVRGGMLDHWNFAWVGHEATRSTGTTLLGAPTLVIDGSAREVNIARVRQRPPGRECRLSGSAVRGCSSVALSLRSVLEFRASFGGHVPKGVLLSLVRSAATCTQRPH